MKRIFLYLTFASLCSIGTVGFSADAKITRDLISVSGTIHGVEPLGIDVDFPGGSINKLIAAIAKADGVSFNVINSDDSVDFTKVELPAFSLRNVALMSLVEVLRNMLEPRGFDLRSVGGPNPNSFVCMVHKMPVPSDKLSASKIQFLSYQLAPFLQSQSVDDIVGAIHAAWELDHSDAADLLHVKFHPGTSILLLSGSQEAINIARNVLAQLKRPPEQTSAAHPADSTQEKK